MNNCLLVGTLPRGFNPGHMDKNDIITFECCWQCANQGPVIRGWRILSHSSVASGMYLLRHEEMLQERRQDLDY